MKIKVVDSIMGSGKTSAAINMINSSDEDTKFIYITPYLTEVERIKKECSSKKFYEPVIKTKGYEVCGKFESLHKLLLSEKNIVSTHSLFSRANEVTRGLIESGNYILILDEVMDVVEQVQLKQSDIEFLVDSGFIKEENGYILWNEKYLDYDGRYNDIKDMALNRNLIKHKDNILLWTFPADIFESFKEVYVLTYLFDAQIQKYYYDMYDIEYEMYAATNENGNYAIRIGSNKEKEKINKKEIKELITIHGGNINNIGNDKHALSKSWYTNKKYLIPVLKRNTENFFKHKVKSKANDTMWTTFKEQESKLKGKGYTKGFVSCNARATNDYKHKNALAYLMNRFMNPIIKGYFDNKGIDVNEDLFAVSELVQWIWRSAIREGKPIDLYIPSKRMRDLLEQWMNE